MGVDRRAFGIGLGAAALAGGAYAQPRPGPVVETTEGRVRGQDLGGVLSFLGLHYGADTSGRNRFQPPAPPPKWAGVRDAFAYGPTAPHLSPRVPRASWNTITNTQVAQSEDCLVLNVWTPATTGKRPVMVWFHGGAFTSGSGSGPNVEGRYFAAAQDAVVVTLNHRLNVLGYFDIGSLAPGFDDSVNVGVLDLVAALKWVRANIAAFGGDPSRVMIFGESGGSLKTSTILATPAAKGLFHAAAMQSAAYLRARTREQSAQTAELVLAQLGLPKARAAEIQAMPYRQLADAVLKLGPKVGFYSTLDGRTMTHHPFDPVPAPTGADVPVLIGFNRTEITIINSVDTQMFDLDQAGYDARLNAIFKPDEAKEVAEVYRAQYPNASLTERYLMAATDQWLFVASAEIARRKTAAGGAPAWFYRFDWRTPVEGGKWRSPHTLEIPFVFQTVRNRQLAGFVGDAPDLTLSDNMARAWASMARTGDPNHSGLPKWEPYDGATRRTMVFNSRSEVLSDPGGPERAVLHKIAFGASTGGRGDRALAARSVLAARSAGDS